MFQMMKTNMRGELTVYKDEKIQQFCLRDNELVDSVASHFKVGSTEVNFYPAKSFSQTSFVINAIQANSLYYSKG